MTKKKSAGKKAEESEKKPKVHKDLEGFEIKVNPLGEITSNYTIEQLNDFLNRSVRDKKLVDRKDLGFEPVGAVTQPGGEDELEEDDDYGFDPDDLGDLSETDQPEQDLLDDADPLDSEDDYGLGEDANFDEFDEPEEER